jgi:uncharacterized protein
VEGTAWRLLPDNPAHAEAARLAALDARRRAEAYAAALGARIGVIASARDAGLRPPGPRPMMLTRAMEATPLPVEAGEQLVAVVVEVERTLEQPGATMRAAIRARFDEALDEYRTTAGFDVPVAVKLASGRTP